jgi:hypothetical protein
MSLSFGTFISVENEIHLWQWRYTDEHGKRRVMSWRMTEATVREFAHVYRDAVKVEGSLEIRNTGVDHRLAALAAEIVAGRRVECAWAAFRIVHFPGDLEAAGELGAWARRSGVGVDFDERKIRIGGILHDVLYVMFAAG